eukprot:TRINITY_DN4230_c0_g1_i1.p1 TRINITY_DN4230_c0_g1~~TRINITY_DN4230_c0_g1_i1.p1  ORF type:complete len:408 (-),score=184.42 TRINITY_DN4230_c0_g1_i1:104-1327(-)
MRWTPLLAAVAATIAAAVLAVRLVSLTSLRQPGGVFGSVRQQTLVPFVAKTPPEVRALDSELCGSAPLNLPTASTELERERVLRAYTVDKLGAGLGDQLVGWLTAYLFALLTNRTFVIAAELPGAPYVWRFDNRGGQQAPPGDAVMLDWYVSTLELAQLLSGDLSLRWPMRYMAVNTNRGMVEHMFGSERYGAQMRSWGLRPGYAWGCLFNRLVAPEPTLLDDFASELDTLTDASVFTIAIHIRAGDWFFGPSFDRRKRTLSTEMGDNLTLWAPAFECALDIEQWAPAADQTVGWLFVSDSSRLRRDFQVVYADKTIVSAIRKAGHVGPKEKHATANRTLADITRLAVGEHWLLGMADAWVIGQSGFAKTAAMRAMRPEFVFWNDHRRPCTAGNQATPAEMQLWSGL